MKITRLNCRFRMAVNEGAGLCPYLLVEVNGLQISALVDTGAQISVISTATLLDLGLSESVNTEYQGLVRGVVGEGQMHGELRSLLIKIYPAGLSSEPMDVQATFKIVQDDSSSFILGMDLLVPLMMNYSVVTKKIQL